MDPTHNHTLHWIRRAGLPKPMQSLVLTYIWKQSHTLLTCEGRRSAYYAK